MSNALPWNLEIKDAYGHDKYAPRHGYCRATVHNPLSIGGKQCGNKAKFGNYCGLHAQQLDAWRRRRDTEAHQEQQL